MKKIYSFIFFFFIITKTYSLEESDFTFLENKTIDYLRQIFWTAFNPRILNREKDIKEKFDSIWKSHRRDEIIKTLKQAFYDAKSIPDGTKDNTFFQINNISDFKKLINKENLHKNYLINFGFNIDKYDRTQREAINSVYNYINFYTREQIIEFINQKVDEYFGNNTNIEDFKRIVLNNNIDFNFKDTKSYISKKETKDSLQYIYGYENYCYNSNSSSIEDNCYAAYNLYTHSKLNTYSKEDFNLKLSTFHKKLNLDNNLDDFIFLIENRKFTYPNNYELLKGLNEETLNNDLIAFETYYRRKTNTEKPLSHLKKYIEDILDLNKKREILDWGINLYPELGEKGMLQDITSNENNLLYGQVKEFIKTKNREELLKYAYNIHTYQNKITSIYDKELFDIIRMNDNKLYEMIFKDTNNNKLLQKKATFTNYATLFDNDAEKYIENLQRNQLKILVKGLIYFFFNILENTSLALYSIPSDKKEELESIKTLNNNELRDKAKKYLNEKLKISSTEQIFDMDIQYKNLYDENFITNYFDHHINIMDFLRSTNINYLRLWLRKYEMIIRRIKGEHHISGGLKNNFMSIEEYSKKELLSNFDEYIFEYPHLFYPENFIKIVGLDTGITPHKYLVENYSGDNINKIIFLIIGHIERKNIQLNFDWPKILSKLIIRIYTDINDFIKNTGLYLIFKIINICPELNNNDLFYYMFVNEETRIKHVRVDPISIDSEQIAKNIIDYYYNMKYNITNLDLENTQKIIYDFLSSEDDDRLRNRVLDGDFYPLFYNYSFFLKDENEVVIDNLYNILYKEKKIENKSSNNLSFNEKINAICNSINNYKELQEPSDFEEKYNKIDIISEGYSNVRNLFTFLEDSNNRDIFYYCLLANIVVIQNKNKKDRINHNEKIRDIYLKIHFMSRLSMIRYILDVAKLNEDFKEILSPKNLPKLVKKYMLDIGSDNIYDFAAF